MRKKKTRKCKILVTQAFDERDLLVKKIADKIEYVDRRLTINSQGVK